MSDLFSLVYIFYVRVTVASMLLLLLLNTSETEVILILPEV